MDDETFPRMNEGTFPVEIVAPGGGAIVKGD